MRVLLVAWSLAVTACYSGSHLDAAAPLEQGDAAGAEGGEATGEDSGEDGDSGGEEPPETQCGEPEVGVQPLRRLTRVQYANSIRDLIGIDTDVAEGFAADERIGAFESNAVAPISNLGVEQYMDAAEDLAIEAMALQRDLVLPCDPTTDGEDACAQSFIRTFGARAHRRPLSEDDVTAYLGVYEAGRAETGFDGGIRLALQAMLQSPYFLYHVEVGDEPGDAGVLEAVVPVTGHELASRLSY